MEDNYNLYQNSINLLINDGNIILQIICPDKSCLYFLVDKFTSDFTGSGDSINFCQLEGVNITNFLKLNVSTDKRNFISKFNQFILDEKPIRVEFSSNFSWIKWSV